MRRIRVGGSASCGTITGEVVAKGRDGLGNFINLLVGDMVIRCDAKEVRPEYRPRRKAPSDGYRRISVSLYEESLERMDRMVERLRARGWRGANISKLIRIAMARLEPELDSLDLAKLRGEAP